MTTAIELITKHAEVYAKVRAALSERVAALNDGLAALKKDCLPEIRRHVNRAAEAENVLRALIEEHPECFAKPKTRILSGVKLGFQKGKGGLEFEDADAVVTRIKKHFPDQADILIQTKEVPVKSALSQLAAADLKKLGVHVTQADDQVVIKPADSEVDKTVDALLKGATEVEA